jgi:hypothetical protein
VPVPKTTATERTKLLEADDAELGKETKAYFHTKPVGLLAIFSASMLAMEPLQCKGTNRVSVVVIWSNIVQAEAVQYLQVRCCQQRALGSLPSHHETCFFRRPTISRSPSSSCASATQHRYVLVL